MTNNKSSKTVAAPKLIDPMAKDYFASPEENRSEYLASKKKGKVVDHPYEGADLVTFGNNYQILDHRKKQVTYLMKWQTRKILGRDAAYQVIVWADTGTTEVRGYARKVFFDQLFSKSGLICTDRIQTPDGRRFWSSVVAHAFAGGFFVYFVDMNAIPRKYVPIPGPEEFTDLDQRGMIWTNGEKGKGQLLLISKEKIQEMHKSTSSSEMNLSSYPTLKALLMGE